MKLRNKLILSCAALAAVATTAVSTTYAWYTSNTEVTATDITAKTKNEGADLLMISKDKVKWGTTISFDGDVFNDMLPVAYTEAASGTGADAKLLTATTTTTADNVKTTTGATAGEQTTKVATFSFYLKNAADTEKTVNMKIVDLVNTTRASLPDKPIIDSATNAKFVGLAETASTYTVNALRVLCADIEVYNYTTGNADPTFTSEAAYSLANAAKSGTTAYTYNDSLDGKAPASGVISAAQTTTYSAKQYYQSVMKETLVDNSAAINTTTIVNSNSVIPFTVPAASDAAHKDDFIGVTIKLFLNGWDEACFDACQGQTFTFDLDFTIPQA